MHPDRPRLLLAVGAYTALLQWSYVNLISPAFAYLGYEAHTVGLFYVAGASLLALAPALWMPLALTRPSQVVYWFLYLVALIPSVTIPMFVFGQPSVWIWRALFLVAAFALLSRILSLPPLPLRRMPLPAGAFWSFVIFLTLATHAVILSGFGFQLRAVDLFDVYRVREQYKSTLQGLGAIVPYAIGWQANVLNPLLMAKGLAARRLLPLAAGLFGQLMIFSITGYKTTLLSVLLLAGILAVATRPDKWALRAASGALGVLVLSLLADRALDTIVFSSLVIRRVIATPGLLTGYYFEFFSQNPKALLGHSVLSSFTDYPYLLAPPQLIGLVYFQNPATSANANIWADAYANFGHLGLGLFSLLLGLVLRTYDGLARDADIRISSLLLGVPAFNLTNSGLLTTLLTHGLALAVAVMYFIPTAEAMPFRHRYAVGPRRPHEWGSEQKRSLQNSRSTAAGAAPQSLMFLYASPRHDSRVQRAANALQNRGIGVRIFCRGINGPDRYDLDGIPIHELPVQTGVRPGEDSPYRRPGGRLERVFWILGYFRGVLSWRADVAAAAGGRPAEGATFWHGHDLVGLMTAHRARKRAGGKGWLIYDSHELLLESGGAALLPRPVRFLLRRYERRLVQACDAVITVNDAIAAELEQRYPIPLPAVVRNCPPAGPDPVPLDSSPLRTIPGLAGKQIVLFHGGLSPHRGIEQLLAAAARLPPTVALVFLGDGHLTELVKTTAALIPDKVFWWPTVPVSDLLAWVAGSDVGVMPIQPVTMNHYLVSPNKLFECLAAGVPVVVSDSPEMRRVVTPHDVGVTCDPRDPEDIRQAIQFLLDEDAVQKHERRLRCRRLAVEQYCWEKESNKLVELYEGLVQL